MPHRILNITKQKVYIGCSGFFYPQWRGKLYPLELPYAKWLEYYAMHFNSVELNGTFYRFPVVKNLSAFYQKTPANFKFSVKVHKIITHTLRMKNTKEKIEEFLKIVTDGLMDKTGCIIFQFPASFRYNESNLENILNNVPSGDQHVVEFRDALWWNKKVYAAFRKHRITFCNINFPKLPEEIFSTTRNFYMRFHGNPVLYKSSYKKENLIKVIDEIPIACKEIYVYFNNTWHSAAWKNAKSMNALSGIKF